MNQRSILEVHLDRLSYNLSLLRDFIKPKTKVCCAVKANAYGHGVIPVSKTLEKAGVDYLAVALLEEALEIREAKIALPILILSPPTPENLEIPHPEGLEWTLSDQAGLDALEKHAQRYGTLHTIHLKIDIGMGRLGCLPNRALGLAGKIEASPWLQQGGLLAHFPWADNGQSSPTKEQYQLFLKTKMEIQEAGIDTGICHISNSAGVLDFPESQMDMVRPGISLYGYWPAVETLNKPRLKPVLEWKARVSLVKQLPAGHGISYGSTYKTKEETMIAVIPVGYGDGFPRALSNKGRVLIHGQTYSIAGRICMDQFMVDLGPNSKVVPGDEVSLICLGGPDADEIAQLIGTIPYEVTCQITPRIPRRFLNAN